MRRDAIYVSGSLARTRDEPHLASLDRCSEAVMSSPSHQTRLTLRVKLKATIFFQSSIVTVVQCFYIYRIWILSERSYKVLLIPVFLTVIRIVVGYVTAVYMFTLQVWPYYRKNHIATIVLSVGLASSAMNDMVITASQVYYLHRRRTGLRGTEYIIRTVMFYSINLGAMTMQATTLSSHPAVVN